MPISPMIAAGIAKSAVMEWISGESEATAERSENANSTIPMTARDLPCHSGRAPAGRGSEAEPERDPPGAEVTHPA